MYFQLRLTALAEKQVEVELELLSLEQRDEKSNLLKNLDDQDRKLLEKKKEYLNTQIFECLESLPQDMQRMMGNMMQGMTPEMMNMMEAMEDKIQGMGLEHLEDPEEDEEENK